ncbi:MAG: TlpA family protein disulfide reductase [Acidimicrobiaceae bacterium]|nr:TlpA family protein disulfide reductase [Acidimicrobiaceae bacterium]MYH00956.1 TlpA family protein disulfide reductase [Acidimicrobiaceae bacterium]MYL03325.1 TlpA family protein disulfide reductase [Acidimicrobiaceae bacterium]
MSASDLRDPDTAPGTPRPSGSSADRWRTAWIAVPLAVAVALLVVVLATRDSAFERNASSPILGGLAPPVVGVTIAGESFDLDQWRGRWVIVNFFQSTCVPCIVEHPELIAFSERHAAAGDARVVSVTFDDTAENVRRFFEVNGGDWPVLVEGASEAAVAYGVTGVPESYLVAPSGVVVWKQLGGVTADGIDDVISELTTAAATP